MANYTKINSLYLIEDTDFVRYKDQSMNAFTLENRTKYTHTLCDQMQTFLMLQNLVHIFTMGFKRLT